MPIGYYLIPMVAGPYSRTNPQRPAYVDEIRCNWTGHNVDALGVYVCKVNTTAAKHTDLASRAGVRQLPLSITWETVISSLTPVQRNAISNWCSNHGIPYDAAETVGDLLMRVINSGLWQLGSTARTAAFATLTAAQQDRIRALCIKWGQPEPQAAETVAALSQRLGAVYWHGPTLPVTEF